MPTRTYQLTNLPTYQFFHLSHSKFLHPVFTTGNHLLVVDPHVARAREHVDVGARLPVGARLAPVRIAEGEMDTRRFFVLQEDADHSFERDIRAECQLADSVAIRVGVTVVPELVLQVRAR